MQHTLDLGRIDEGQSPRDRSAILADLSALQRMVEQGILGGEQMPEDVHPRLDPASAANYHYFSLTMALNYQRDSYALWRAATATFNDADTADVFDPRSVIALAQPDLQAKLLKHRLALQQNKHTEIWRRLSQGIVTLLDGDIRNLFSSTRGDVGQILEFVQKKEKQHFPYLCGPKICHYWLYVMEQYTDVRLTARHLISVAPDTHVVKATSRLGIIPRDVSESTQAQRATVAGWDGVLRGTGIQPIDIHTRLWLWSRAGFPAIESRARSST